MANMKREISSNLGVTLTHQHQEVVEVLTTCFEGLLGTDRGTSYEAEALDGIEQQKCLSHLLKNLSTVEETKSGRALTFTREPKETLREAIKVWQEYRDGTCGLEAYREKGTRIRQRLDHQLRDRRLKGKPLTEARWIEGAGVGRLSQILYRMRKLPNFLFGADHLRDIKL
jgi:hypothetical protein